jgi:hypothetical protein
MQGVSINIFIKTGKKKTNELGKVFHFDLFGKRDFKYDFLSEISIKSISFNELKPEKPFFLFVSRSNKGLNEYEQFKLSDLFNLNSVGMVSARDKFCIDDKGEECCFLCIFCQNLMDNKLLTSSKKEPQI